MSYPLTAPNATPAPPVAPAIHASRHKPRHILCLLLLALLLTGNTLSTHAQTPADPSTQDEVVEQLPPVAAVIPPPTLGDRFNAVLGGINNVAYATLFADVSFGAFREPVLDDEGQPLYEQVPVMVPVKDEIFGQQVDAQGQPILVDGRAQAVTVVIGSQTQQIVDGKPVFTDGPAEMKGPELPFLVVFLSLGALFYTVFHGFINLRGFGHAIAVVRGKWSANADEGDVTPFQALTSALSATVGLGNISSVAFAMVTGGPGALLWMMVLGLLGMSSKFHESTLAQMYRIKNADGSVSGGPMFYLDHGLRQVHPTLGVLGKPLAVIFAIFCMGAAVGGGNMFQSNQAYEGFFSTFVAPHAVVEDIDALEQNISYGFGLVMAVLVGVVVVGGITRIGAATSKIVPLMGLIYVAACATIILFNLAALPEVIALVFREAFAMQSAVGGILGAMMIGFQRAAFSSEAGLGSSAIAHAAAKTNEPLREGFVASLEPFVDTIVICCMTGLTVLITGAYLSEGGSSVTLEAFEQVPALAGWFPYILSICIILFAFSTMISWCYYGERAWGYLFGLRSVIVFRLFFVFCVFVGAVVTLEQVIGFADAMLLSMAIPNILGGLLLAPMVRRRLKVYWSKYRDGTLVPGEPVAPIPRDELSYETRVTS